MIKVCHFLTQYQHQLMKSQINKVQSKQFMTIIKHLVMILEEAKEIEEDTDIEEEVEEEDKIGVNIIIN